MRFSERVALAIVPHELETRGYVPLFLDATCIEVDGHLFERTRTDYDGNRCYWLHAYLWGAVVGGAIAARRRSDAELAPAA